MFFFRGKFNSSLKNINLPPRTSLVLPSLRRPEARGPPRPFGFYRLPRPVRRRRLLGPAGQMGGFHVRAEASACGDACAGGEAGKSFSQGGWELDGGV